MMGNSSIMQYANYLIILSLCIDQGDGRWKERDKENLRQDIMVYKKMAEKLEHEIQIFYDEYPDESLSYVNNRREHYKYLTNLLDRNQATTKRSDNKEKHKNSRVSSDANTLKAESSEITNKINATQRCIDNISNCESKKSDWPKFEDILLAIGRKYDWKNDRWIKVRDKQKAKINDAMINAKHDKVEFLEKHKFSYRIVRLSRRKSRRNVVVAVSAVR